MICGKFNKNVQLVGKKPRIVGPFCLEHAYDRLDEEKAKAKESEEK